MFVCFGFIEFVGFGVLFEVVGNCYGVGYVVGQIGGECGYLLFVGFYCVDYGECGEVGNNKYDDQLYVGLQVEVVEYLSGGMYGDLLE